MAASLEETLISVWRQVMVEGAKTVTVEGRNFPGRRTSRSKLREVDFRFDAHELRGLEQNPRTSSRWARLAREGKGHAFSQRTTLHRRWGGWKGAVLGKAGLDELERQV
jgi:hypothetical protein